MAVVRLVVAVVELIRRVSACCMLRLRRAELANSDALPVEAGVEEVEEEEEKAGDGEREVREVSEGRGDEAAVLAGEAEANAGAEVGRGAEAEAEEEVNCSVGL